MVYCAIDGCRNYWSKKNKQQQVRYFTFPKDNKIRKHWIDACGKTSNIKSPRICSVHFLEEDYRIQDILLNIPNEKKRLKKGAIPTKNLPAGCGTTSLRSNRTRKQLVEDYLNGLDKNNYDELDQNSNSAEVDNNDIQISFDMVCDSFSQNEENAKEIGIQCNLYEELLKDKIQTIQFKECSCYEEILNIIDSFNPIDTNLELLLKDDIENNISMNEEFIDNENDINDSTTYLNNEEFNLSHENVEKWSDFENILNDDSSDYGLSEIPFPEIPKQQKKTNEDHLILYECAVCQKDFKSYYLFDTHYTKFHAERSKLCSICGRIITSFRRLQRHENHCNPNDNPYCYECKHFFNSKINYYDHYNIKHEKKSPYVCCCNKSFILYTKFVVHLNKYHCGTIDMCTIPDYTTKEFLETFLELKCNKDDENIVTNSDNITEEKKLKFWCRICKTNFHNNRTYMVHFDKEYHLNIEKEWIEEYDIEKDFECEVCDKKISELSDLVKHRHKYHRKFTLEEFIKNLEYRPNIHIKPILITQPTDYSTINSICHICKKNFFMPNFEFHFKEMEHINLEKKWLKDHNIKEFNCFDCSISYKSLLSYLIHKKSEHNEWPTNFVLKSIIGDIDDSIPDFLKDEINTKLIYKCSICNYYTKYRKVYIQHMLYHYPKKYFKCSCGKRFVYHDLLLNHRNKTKCKKEGCITPTFVIQSNSFVNANFLESHSKSRKLKSL